MGASDPIDPLYVEPAIETEEVPAPKLFLDVVQRQWAALISSSTPNNLNQRFYSIDMEFANTLQVPTVDSPVVALSAPSVLTGPPEEVLPPVDKRFEQSLVKAHQSAAWSIKASTVASFFNRASLLWLQQLQEWLPATDMRSQQDLNKIVAALEFSVDATLNASRFAAKSISTTTASHRLLWLHQMPETNGGLPSPHMPGTNCLVNFWIWYSGRIQR